LIRSTIFFLHQIQDFFLERSTSILEVLSPAQQQQTLHSFPPLMICKIDDVTDNWMLSYSF